MTRNGRKIVDAARAAARSARARVAATEQAKQKAARKIAALKGWAKRRPESEAALRLLLAKQAERAERLEAARLQAAKARAEEIAYRDREAAEERARKDRRNTRERERRAAKREGREIPKPPGRRPKGSEEGGDPFEREGIRDFRFFGHEKAPKPGVTPPSKEDDRTKSWGHDRQIPRDEDTIAQADKARPWLSKMIEIIAEGARREYYDASTGNPAKFRARAFNNRDLSWSGEIRVKASGDAGRIIAALEEGLFTRGVYAPDVGRLYIQTEFSFQTSDPAFDRSRYLTTRERKAGNALRNYRRRWQNVGAAMLRLKESLALMAGRYSDLRLGAIVLRLYWRPEWSGDARHDTED